MSFHDPEDGDQSSQASFDLLDSRSNVSSAQTPEKRSKLGVSPIYGSHTNLNTLTHLQQTTGRGSSAGSSGKYNPTVSIPRNRSSLHAREVYKKHEKAVFDSQIKRNIHEYLRIRKGTVLRKGLILKIDDYSARSANTSVPTTISGASNLRQISCTKILGSAQPSISGIMGVLNALGASREFLLEDSVMGVDEILWTNLREEPIIFINGRSVLLREFDEPFRNMSHFRGMTRQRIEEYENKLKEDCVRECQRSKGMLLLHSELSNRELQGFWEGVRPVDIKTPKEVFLELQMNGYKAKYKRLPMTPEKAPPKNYFDTLVKNLLKISTDGTILYNCQTGRSRSTFAMVSTCLLQLWRGSGFSQPQPPATGERDLLHSPSLLIRRNSSRKNSLSRDQRSASRHRRRRSSLHSKSLLKASFSSRTINRGALLEQVAEAPPREEVASHGHQRSASDTPPSSDLETSDDTIYAMERIASPKDSFPTSTLVGERVKRVLTGKSLQEMERELEMNETPKVSFDSDVDDISSKLMSGWYQPVIEILRLVESGRSAKMHVDYFVDECDQLLNLRESIYRHRSKASKTQSDEERAYQLKRAGTCLLRYIMLILFDCYLDEQVQKAFPMQMSLVDEGPRNVFSLSFESWLDTRQELRRIIFGIMENPENALESPLSGFYALTQNFDFEMTEKNKEVIKVMLGRSGSMLNADSIIKLDNLQSFQLKKERLLVKIKGAVNFRILPGTRIAGVCTPTFSGALSVIEYLCALKEEVEGDEGTSAGREPLRIIWTNLREEPILYINDKPCMLRSMAKPFTSVDTFSSVDADRLENSEERLKNDVVKESKRLGNKVLLHMEEKQMEIVPIWEDVDDSENILTPKQVFENLSSAFDESEAVINYKRSGWVPESAPSPDEIESVLERSNGLRADSSSWVIFNCQMGRGRSTFAMVITFLNLYASALKELPQKNVNRSSYIWNEYEASARKTMNELDNFDVRENALFDTEENTKAEHSKSFLRASNRSFPMSDNATDEGNRGDKTRSEIKESGDFATILSLMQVLRNGKQAKNWADYAIDRCGSVENMRDRIKKYSLKASLSRTEEKSKTYTDRALMYLKRYFMIICVASYVLEKNDKEPGVEIRRSQLRSKSYADASPQLAQDNSLEGLSKSSRFGSLHEDSAMTLESPLRRFSSFSDNVDHPTHSKTFTDWFACRPELLTLFKTLDSASALKTVHSDPEKALQHLTSFSSIDLSPVTANRLEAVADEEELKRRQEDETREMIAARAGNVLVRGSILKNDHFPGCERIVNPLTRIEGMPNFRQILAGTVITDGLSDVKDLSDLAKVYGTGIPTMDGLKTLFDEFRREKKQGLRVVCINLREEPILYVLGKPYVVRESSHPFENLEYTGINTERVEAMENRLLADVESEIQVNGRGKLLLHDEDEFGVVSVLEDVDSGRGSMLTPKQMYNNLGAGSGIEFEYHRVPVTDEQAFKLSDFDRLLGIIRSSYAPTSIMNESRFILNCQMGRGRTTTGICVAIAANLWLLGELRKLPSRLETSPKFLAKTNSVIRKQFLPEDHPQHMKKSDIPKAELDMRRGKLKTLENLLLVLHEGKEAKRIMDLIIDASDNVQNLREAMFELKHQMDDAKNQSAVKHASIKSRGRQYLKRYAMLIVFTAYLLDNERQAGAVWKPMETFSQYVSSRREIGSSLKKLAFL